MLAKEDMAHKGAAFASFSADEVDTFIDEPVQELSIPKVKPRLHRQAESLLSDNLELSPLKVTGRRNSSSSGEKSLRKSSIKESLPVANLKPGLKLSSTPTESPAKGSSGDSERVSSEEVKEVSDYEASKKSEKSEKSEKSIKSVKRSVSGSDERPAVSAKREPDQKSRREPGDAARRGSTAKQVDDKEREKDKDREKDKEKEKGKNSTLKKKALGLLKFRDYVRKSKSEEEPKTSDPLPETVYSSLTTVSTISEPALAPIVEVVDTSTSGPPSDSSDFSHILGIHVHNTDRKLKCAKLVFHPVVKVHVIDAASGQYLTKKHCDRNVVSYYENSDKLIDYVMPIMTQPCDLVTKIRYPRFPIWEELLLYNEDYEHFLREDVILFLEVLDFVSLEESNAKARLLNLKGEQWWYRIAWAFLRLVGAEGHLNTEKKLRLQLYEPISLKMNNDLRLSLTKTTELFSWWSSNKRLPFPGSLYVTIKPILLSQSQQKVRPCLRSLLPFQMEEGLSVPVPEKTKEVTYAEEPSSGPRNDPQSFSIWSRVEGQPCKVPKNRWHELSAGNNKSCYSLRFSNDGRKLACGASVFAAYLSAEKRSSVFIFELPSGTFFKRVNGFHLGTIYDLDWSPDDKFVLSSSNDCTAQVWPVYKDKPAPIVLPHPCFIYSSKFCPNNQYLIFTGAFDGLIRLWSLKNCLELHPGYNKEPELIREIDGHRGQVLSLCWKRFWDQENNDHLTLFSSGSNGVIILWRQKDSLTDTEWLPMSKIRIPELKNVPINGIQVSPAGNKMLLCCRDGVLRMIDYQLEIVVQKYPGSFNFSHLIRGSLSPCGKFIFMGSEDGMVHVWAADTGERVHSYGEMPFRGPVTCVQYHPHDHALAMCGLGGRTVSICLYKHNYQPMVPKLAPVAPNRRKLVKSHTIAQSDVPSASPLSADVKEGKDNKMKKAMKKIEIALKMKSFDQN